MLRNANERTEHDSRSNPDIYKSLGYESIELAGLKSCSQTL